jgi:hypothetical protein
LELSRALPLRQYRPHYRPPLELVGGSAMVAFNWSI